MHDSAQELNPNTGLRQHPNPNPLYDKGVKFHSLLFIWRIFVNQIETLPFLSL
jgi:hypothetical protein